MDWGNPVEFMLSAGNDHDSVHAVELLEKVEISESNVLADASPPSLLEATSSRVPIVLLSIHIALWPYFRTFI